MQSECEYALYKIANSIEQKLKLEAIINPNHNVPLYFLTNCSRREWNNTLTLSYKTVLSKVLTFLFKSLSHKSSKLVYPSFLESREITAIALQGGYSRKQYGAHPLHGFQCPNVSPLSHINERQHYQSTIINSALRVKITPVISAVSSFCASSVWILILMVHQVQSLMTN